MLSFQKEIRGCKKGRTRSATLMSRLDLLTIRRNISQTGNGILTSHQRMPAGRSQSSITSSRYSHTSTHITSPSTTSSNFSNVISDCTSAVDHSEISWQLQLRSEDIQSHLVESRSHSSEASTSLKSHDRNLLQGERSSCPEYIRASGGTSPGDAHKSRRKSSSNESDCTEGSSGNNLSFGRTSLEHTRSSRQSGCSPGPRNNKDYLGFQRFQRQSRWDDYQASKGLSISTETMARPQRARSISVEHRGDSSLFDNDREFEALKANKSAQKEWNKRFPEGTIVVYTDGSCIDNRASGFGIYFGPNHPLNRSEKIIGPIHNSGLAEILAAQMALQLLRNWDGYKNEPVILRTDFLPLVQAMNGGVCDRFCEEIEKMRNLATLYPNGVRFEHVYAHDGDPGNEQADALARIATASARRSRSATVPRFRNSSALDGRRARSRSPRRSWRRSRSITREINRSRSRNNDPHHIRSHSAFVPGRRR
ncbi:hypothetical protein Angca_004763 [Angiostrongylus cantonensis]|nr:hypothetical protein Angca_004763 [Angiostrongylus cantonensis]